MHLGCFLARVAAEFLGIFRLRKRCFCWFLYQSILQELSIACDIYAGVGVGFRTMHSFTSSLDGSWLLVIVVVSDGPVIQRFLSL